MRDTFCSIAEKGGVRMSRHALFLPYQNQGLEGKREMSGMSLSLLKSNDREQLVRREQNGAANR